MTMRPRCLVLCAGWAQRRDQFDLLQDVWSLNDFYTVDISPSAGADTTADITDPTFLNSIAIGAFRNIAFLNCSAEGTLFLKNSDGSNTLNVGLLQTLISKLPPGGSLIIDNLIGVVPFLATYFQLPVRGPVRRDMLARYSGYIEDATRLLLQGGEPNPLFSEITDWLAALLPGSEVEMILVPGKLLPVVEIIRL